MGFSSYRAQCARYDEKPINYTLYLLRIIHKHNDPHHYQNDAQTSHAQE